MKDKELLDFAARSIGGIYDSGFITTDGGIDFDQWDPLDDDGDAFRLAVNLGLIVKFPRAINSVFVQVGENPGCCTLEKINGDTLSASRRAIVKAAAEIGRGMK
jgi:hypothetical protein